MNRSGLVRSVVVFAFGCYAGVLACYAGLSFAQQALEIIPLRHRSVEQVLPALQPLLEPGATLSGTRGQLLLRASPSNAAEIKRALAAVDQPSRRLVISVRLDDSFERERRDISVSGAASSSGARVGVTAQESRRAGEERVDQRVQVLEGGRAFIATGRSQPVVIQGTTAFQDRTSGFEVIPRLSGNQVMLEIAQQRPGQALATTVSGRLGEWVELGAIAQSMTSTGAREAQARRVSVKVEELGN